MKYHFSIDDYWEEVGRCVAYEVSYGFQNYIVETMTNWIKENLEEMPDFDITGSEIALWFTNDDDATLFRLRFG